MHCLSRPRRPLRSGEWTPAKTVTFVVTLAASGSVTLAARQAGMSRKSAYALKARDIAFARAWEAAVAARAKPPAEGNKVEEVEDAPLSPRQGDNPTRERVSADLVARLRQSPPLAA